MYYPDGSCEEETPVFDTEAEAAEYGSYMCACYSEGAETLFLSNPYDNPEPDDDDRADFEIVEIDD